MKYWIKNSLIIILAVFLIIVSINFSRLLVNNKYQNDVLPNNNEITSKEDTNNILGKTFQTTDGVNNLRIVDINDISSIEKAEQDSEYNSDLSFRKYFAYYNNKLYFMNESIGDDKYLVLSGRKIGVETPMCTDTHQFIVNTKDNTLVNLSYEQDDKSGYYYKIYYINGNYYFAKGDCGGMFIPIKLYDENLLELGEYLINYDSDSVYILNNGKIIQYNQNSKIIKQSNIKYDLSHLLSGSLVYNNNIYFIYEKNNTLYLIDAFNNKEYEIGKNYFLCKVGADCDPVRLELINNTMRIYLNKLDNYEKIDVFEFDINSKILTKM